MERLTTDIDYEIDKGAYERHLKQGYPRNMARERFLRLCEYERTGHTPEEIAEFYNMYLAKCEEVNRLAAELEEARKRLPPCNVGDTVWDIDFGKTCSYIVTGFSYGNLNDCCDDDSEVYDQIIVYYETVSGEILCKVAASDIGKTVFLTESEAQEALKRLESEQNE